MLIITKRFHFSASHRLSLPELSDKENYHLFGKCSNPNGHGHNYELEVTLEGKQDDRTGYIYDLSKLKLLVNEKIISKVDHKNLNIDVDFMKGVNPTAENLVLKFWEQLEPQFRNLKTKLFSVKLYETQNNIAEYKGEK